MGEVVTLKVDRDFVRIIVSERDCEFLRSLGVLYWSTAESYLKGLLEFDLYWIDSDRRDRAIMHEHMVPYLLASKHPSNSQLIKHFALREEISS